MNKYLAALGLTLVAILSACTVLPQPETIQVYRLPERGIQGAPGVPLPLDLRVMTPQADRMLDSTRIAVIPEGDQVNYYQGVRWNASAPTLVRDRLLEAYIESAAFRAVSSDDSHLFAQLELHGDLRKFQAEVEGTGTQVLVRLDANLVGSNDRRVLASKRFDIVQASDGKQAADVVAAFGRALDLLANEVVVWSREQSKNGLRPAK